MRFTKKFELSMRFVGANRFAKAAAPKRKHHVLPYFQVVHNRMAWAHMTVKRFAFNDGTFPHMVQAGISAARAVQIIKSIWLAILSGFHKNSIVASLQFDVSCKSVLTLGLPKISTEITLDLYCITILITHQGMSTTTKVDPGTLRKTTR